MLVDFGTDRYVADYTFLKKGMSALGKSCELLEEKIVEHGKIDILVISHTDNDHISLLVKLLQSCQVKVGRVLLGGTPIGRHSLASFWYDKAAEQKGSKTLKALGELLLRICPGQENQIQLFASMNHYFVNKGDHFLPKTEGAVWLEEWRFGFSQEKNPRALLRVVTSRHFIDDERLSKDAGAYINANSVVLAMEVYGDEKGSVPASVIFLTGDIQWTTMEYLTMCFEQGGTACFPFLSAGVHRAMIIPHHGALKTACKGNNIKKNTDGTNPLEVQLEDLKRWGEKMGCEILAVSAKAGRNRKHPCQQTMERLCTGYLRDNMPDHQNVAMSAVLLQKKAACQYTQTVSPAERRALYTSYVGQVPDNTQAVKTARSVILSVDETGTMDVTVDEREGA